ncbi:SpoIIE family protein phosphatase [Parageobacillus thermoglucosidasius]|uniref:SpoIIE family protein phosphatase n=1 Tax=Parageobacillus thermoglucosidasius TaxID=1426 RepID=UPI002E1B3DDA|nr:SpoIIE family protein phosphatase [Parageobacillus thermoglucosidasius]MED4903477.1 SpoIIE family protein phosphatase [Parageobacillus thermoglucosidasius]MED4912814.1 SpoIIE family protein phosphatase [Parageobacillus thermoglucosidasius]MED4945204.1 SpoIIE family protein phosphatase [Parageobacillus thermoglucosidasius]MED4982313.1 SpoIIE family protein phosphatase [Parageobacillus thermoglucosidasius]
MKLDLQTIGKTCSHRTGEGIVITDRNKVIVAVNDGAAALTGYSKEQLIGQSFYFLVSDEHHVEQYEFIWKSVLEHGYWEGKINYHIGGDRKLAQTLTVYALTGTADEFYIWRFSNIETTIHSPEPEHMLQAIYQTAPIAVISLCKNMAVKEWGNAAETLFGWKREEVIGREFISLFPDQPSRMALFSHPFKGEGEKERVATGECTVRRKDGTFVDVAYSAISVTDSEGNVTGYIMMADDITKQKQKEMEYKKQVELAKKIQQSVLTPPIQNDVVTMDAIYIPSDDLSGDMYACYQIDYDRYGVIIIDVMGHGISSSLVSMLLRSLLRGLIVRVIDPVYVAIELENHVRNLFPSHANELRYLFSMIYLVIDTKKKQIEYTNAGHPAGLLVTEDGEVIELDKGGLAIGSPFSVPFEKGVIRYRRRTRLFLYTDGILEEIDPSILQSMNKIRRYAKMYSHLPDKQFLRMLIDHDRSPVNPADDICLLSITIQ